MSYTPGPWSIKYLSGIDMLIVSENRKICSFSGFSHSIELMDEHENGERANANLIAAAPIMYEFILSLSNNGDVEAKKIIESIYGPS